MLRPSAFSYQIAVQHSTTINVASDDCLFVVCVLALQRCDWRRGVKVAVPPKVMLAGVALAPRKFCEKVKGTYPSPIPFRGWSGGPWQAILSGRLR
jgi:hypothetical protein